MKKIRIKFLTLLVVLSFCGAASAANQMNTGCGLGTMLLGKQDDTKLMQVLITSTNQVFTTNQSTGITLDIQAFGCTPTRRWVSADVQYFVQGNMDSLVRDVAAGQGETIDSLAVLMEVEDVDSFGSKLQQNFTLIFPSSDVEYTYVAEAIETIRGS